MMKVERMSTSVEYTRMLAAGLAGILRSGDVVLLEGEMGAGKTTLTRGLAEAMGVEPGAISSPTYVIVNRYVGRELAITHMDCYRLTGSEDLEPLGWDRLFGMDGMAATGSIALIEWPERIGEALPGRERCIVARLEHTGEESRRMEFAFPAHVAARDEAQTFASREPITCPTTGAWVSPLGAFWPFASERAKMADLGKWLTGGYTLSRPLDEDDVAEE
jgi:tRNA threonylcarbamoyladenosine biosynthesis protein TsaE